MIAQLANGISDYSTAIGMISRHRLWRFVIIPGLLSVGLISFLLVGPALAFVMGGGEAAFEDTLISWYPFGWGAEAFATFIHWIPFWLLLVAVMAFLMFFIGKYIILIVASPFMGALSEKVETILTGRIPPDDSHFFADLIRGIRISVRNLIREIGFTLLFLFLHLLPVVGTFAAGALTFMVEAFYAGFGNMDYTLERKRFNIRQSVHFVRRNRWGAIGNGIGFLLLLFIPVIGWFLAPAYGTIAATALVLRQFEKEGIPIEGMRKA
ncbi:MAG: coproporphyrinogen III oxidase [Bacteroidetes bacterium]|nr:MAG: coproporphyrinogen III oxidase [Bacteroidota bacterium]